MRSTSRSLRLELLHILQQLPPDSVPHPLLSAAAFSFQVLFEGFDGLEIFGIGLLCFKVAALGIERFVTSLNDGFHYGLLIVPRPLRTG